MCNRVLGVYFEALHVLHTKLSPVHTGKSVPYVTYLAYVHGYGHGHGHG